MPVIGNLDHKFLSKGHEMKKLFLILNSFFEQIPTKQRNRKWRVWI